MSAFDREDCTVAPSIEIERRLFDLISFVDMLELQLQHMALGDEALGTARRQLRELDATSAMDVLKLLDQTAKRWSIAAGPQLSALKNAERMLRDIVVMFLVNRGGADAVGDRQVFLETAEGITGTPLDRELRAKLLLAYPKLKQHRQGIWLGGGPPTIQWLVILRVAGNVAKG